MTPKGPYGTNSRNYSPDYLDNYTPAANRESTVMAATNSSFLGIKLQSMMGESPPASPQPGRKGKNQDVLVEDRDRVRMNVT